MQLYNTKGIIKNLFTPYIESIHPLKNIHMYPKLKFIKINAGINRTSANKYGVEAYTERILNNLTKICLQKPITIKARVSNSKFNIRKGFIVASACTLRNNNAWSFLDRLKIGLLYSNYFKKIEVKQIQNNKNNIYSLSFGIPDIDIFPEIKSFDMIKLGFNVTVVVTSASLETAILYFQALGIPFEKFDQNILAMHYKEEK